MLLTLAALVLVGGLALWLRPEPSATSADIEQRRASLPTEPVTAAGAPVAVDSGRTAADSRPSPAPVELLLSVRDSSGTFRTDGRALLEIEGQELAMSAVGSQFERRIECGSYTLALGHFAGCLPTRRQLEVDSDTQIEVVLEARPTIDVTFVTADGRRLAAVADRGIPSLPSLFPRAFASDLAPGRELHAAPRRGQRFLAGVELGPSTDCDERVELWGELPVYVGAAIGTAVVDVRVVTSAAPLELIVRPEQLAAQSGALSVCLRDAGTGQAIKSMPALGFATAATGAASYLLPTNAEGCVRAFELPPGPTPVMLAPPGYIRVELPWVRIEPGQTTDLGELTLEHGACASGALLTRSGDGVSASMWAAIDTPGGLTRLRTGVRSDSKLDGWFGVCSLPRGTVWIGCEHADYAVNPQPVQVNAERIAAGTFVAQAGTLLHLNFEDDEAGWRLVSLRSATGDPVWIWEGEQRTDSLRLLPGEYVVRFVAPTGEPHSATLTVEDAPMVASLHPRG